MLSLPIPQMCRRILEGDHLTNEQRISIREHLQRLVADIPAFAESEGYHGLFDEFVREDEFGLALDTVLDYLEESATPALALSTIETLEWLHTAMTLTPVRLAALRRTTR